jgi:hypothetical protein
MQEGPMAPSRLAANPIYVVLSGPFRPFDRFRPGQGRRGPVFVRRRRVLELDQIAIPNHIPKP